MKETLRAKVLTIMLTLFVLACGTFFPVAGQKQKEARKRDASALRRAFEEACGKDFEIVKDELRSRTVKQGGDVYWLVYFKPKHSGEFAIKYRYDYDDPLYTYVEREINLHIEERGCRRWLRNYTIASACLGDTIILPVVVGNYTNHTFSLTSLEVSKMSEETLAAWQRAEEMGMSAEQVDNPASEFLKYVGRQVHYMPHRAPGYTLEYTATFEVLKPGKFNISVGSRLPSDVQPALSASGSVPIFIVDRGAPVTLLLSKESVTGRDEKRGFESHSGNEYLTTVKILQVGDRLTLQYAGRSSRKEPLRGEGQMREQWLKEAVPAIGLWPFSVETEYDYDAWLVDFLNAPAQKH
jgi:hypothetical protein